MVNDTTRLLGLDGLVAERVELDVVGVPVVDLSTGSEWARCCPMCGQRAVRVKQWTATRLRDLPVAGRAVRLRWRKRRWYCQTPECPRKSFTEQVEQVPARARVATRLRQAAAAAVADGDHTIVQAARDLGLSWPVVHAAFTAHAAVVLRASRNQWRGWASTRSAEASLAGVWTRSRRRGRPPSTAGTSVSSI